MDTNVLSEARKGSRAALGVRNWLVSVDAEDLYVSVLALGEIRRGIEKLRPQAPDQAHVIERWLETLYQEFSDRVVPVSLAIADEWGRMSPPNPLPAIDGLMAATAKVMNLTMVTRNVRHYAGTDLRLLNPFDDTPVRFR